MSFSWDYYYDKDHLLIGEIDVVDNSFDHSFGTQKIKNFEVKKMSVCKLVKDNFVDVTDKIEKSDFERMKEKLLETLYETFPEKVS